MNESNEKGITRRQMLAAFAAMGAATLGAGVLGGCSSSRAGSSSQATPSSAAAQSSSASASASSSASSAASSSSAGPSASSAAGASSASASVQTAGGTLVAVFSWSGNTLAVAERVAQDLHAELFRIEPTTPYTTNYDEMLQIAQDERAAGVMPAISGNVQNWNTYSTIYLGFPTWWGHLPQIVKSFLAEYDCSNKVIYPFNTHGGSGFASCLSDLASACPGADVREGLSLLGDNVSSSTERIDNWVASNA